ncbi:N-6 DNA methylase [Haloechinothrix salitolerans]|uniref:N-6 DNA methylase n=1 Tax=Haloechinothrix salitolerans TaxID=926830 RepID=A0ABW2BZ60_9PSEU
MSEDSLVTASEVAKLAGVGRAAVSNWRRRYADFPDPVGGTGSSPTFRYADVERWLREQGRLAVSPTDELWRALDTGHQDTDVTTSVAGMAAYLAGLTDGSDLDPHVRGQADALEGSTRPEAIEHLVGRLFERQQRQHLTTPQGLADLVVALANPVAGIVFDPACGPGTVLRTAARHGARTLHGQEHEPDLAQLASARLALAEAETASVDVGDSLRADAYPDLRADVVLCDPPFGYRDWGHEELVIDRRWEYGTPPKTEPELAWLQHCLAHTAAGGTVVMVLPAGVSSRRSGRGIRKELLRAGALRAVVALPAGVLMSTGIPLHVWVLRNPDGQGAEPVLLLDTSHLAPERRGKADWQAIRAAILAPWREFRASGTVAEVAGRQRTIDVIDLLDEDVDVTPSRHLPLPAMPLDVNELQRGSAELAASLRELAARLPNTLREGRRGTKSTTTINDLARAGAITVRQATGRLSTTDDLDSDGPLVLSGRDLANGVSPSARLVEPSEDAIELRRGDVVAAMVVAGERPYAEVIGVDGLVLGRSVQLLRVDPDRVDPHFLAGLLRTRSLLRSATTSSGGLRLDFRRVEVPVLDIGEQRRIGEQLRQVHDVETGLYDAAERGKTLAQHLTDGLAAGAVEVFEHTDPGRRLRH